MSSENNPTWRRSTNVCAHVCKLASKSWLDLSSWGGMPKSYNAQIISYPINSVRWSVSQVNINNPRYFKPQMAYNDMNKIGIVCLQ